MGDPDIIARVLSTSRTGGPGAEGEAGVTINGIKFFGLAAAAAFAQDVSCCVIYPHAGGAAARTGRTRTEVRASQKKGVQSKDAMAVSSSDGVYVYTGSLHERRVPEGVTKVMCRGDVKVIRSAAFAEVRL